MYQPVVVPNVTETYISRGLDSWFESALMETTLARLTDCQDPPQYCGCVDFTLRRYEWRTTMKSRWEARIETIIYCYDVVTCQ